MCNFIHSVVTFLLTWTEYSKILWLNVWFWVHIQKRGYFWCTNKRVGSPTYGTSQMITSRALEGTLNSPEINNISNNTLCNVLSQLCQNMEIISFGWSGDGVRLWVCTRVMWGTFMGVGKPDLWGARVGSTSEGGWGRRRGWPRGVRRVGRRGTQTTGQKGSHEGGGRIAHQSTAYITKGTKGEERKKNKTTDLEHECDHIISVKDYTGSPHNWKNMAPTGSLRWNHQVGKKKENGWERVCEKKCETLLPLNCQQPSSLVFSPLTPALPVGRQRSHLTAEYTLSQALSLSLSHTFAPAPQRPFLNFSPSLHYLVLSISHFHALNLFYCFAPFHLHSFLSFYSFNLAFLSEITVLFPSFFSIFMIPFWYFAPFSSSLLCLVTTAICFYYFSNFDEQEKK